MGVANIVLPTSLQCVDIVMEVWYVGGMANLNMRLSDEQMERLRVLAAADGRTVSGYVRRLIESAGRVDVVGAGGGWRQVGPGRVVPYDPDNVPV